MALQSAFRERLGGMESTRNQRLSLLQDEKELQKRKSLLLSAKHAKIRLQEQRYLILDKKFASVNFKISSLKSEIECLDLQFQTYTQQLRDLKAEIEELEQLNAEKDRYYALKYSEMNEFNKKIEKFAEDTGSRIKELRRGNEKGSNSEGGYCDIQAAKARKSELTVLKENLANNLESNKCLRATLQEQLQSLW